MFAKPLVERDSALQSLTRRRLPLWPGKKPSPQKIELIYFPYYLFKISVAIGGGKREICVAADGLLGDLALPEMGTLEFLEQADSPRFNFQISMEEAREKVLDECRWVLVKHGFHRRNLPRMEAVAGVRRFYYPYWVAYYRKRKGYDFRAVDGLSRAPIAIRTRRALLAAFAQ